MTTTEQSEYYGQLAASLRRRAFELEEQGNRPSVPTMYEIGILIGAVGILVFISTTFAYWPEHFLSVTPDRAAAIENVLVSDGVVLTLGVTTGVLQLVALAQIAVLWMRRGQALSRAKKIVESVGGRREFISSYGQEVEAEAGSEVPPRATWEAWAGSDVELIEAIQLRNALLESGEYSQAAQLEQALPAEFWSRYSSYLTSPEAEGPQMRGASAPIAPPPRPPVRPRPPRISGPARTRPGGVGSGEE